MPNEITIPVIRIIQKGKTLYIGRISAGDLIDHGLLTEWDPDLSWDLEAQGYQRAPEEKHYKRIATFLKDEGDPLLPTSALVAAREPEYGLLNYQTDIGDPDVGRLILPETRQLFIVDYQHRWRGIKYAIENLHCDQLKQFQVPVIIMADVTRYEEIRQFYLVNSKQKRVNTDLGLALLQTMASVADEAELSNFVGPGNKFRIRGTRLAFRIAGYASGPWAGKIIDPNMIATGNQVLSIKSLVDSLRPILVRTSPVCSRSDEELIEMLIQYWEGVGRLMPDALENPTRYTLQKTVGVFVMHRIAAKHIFHTCAAAGDFSPDRIFQILNEAKSFNVTNDNDHQYFDEDFWLVGGPSKGYSSSSGQNILAQRMIEYL